MSQKEIETNHLKNTKNKNITKENPRKNLVLSEHLTKTSSPTSPAALPTHFVIKYKVNTKIRTGKMGKL